MTAPSSPLPHSGVMAIAPYQTATTTKVQLPIYLASNEGAFGASPLAVKACRQVAEGIFRYPDSKTTDLRQALAESYGLEPERIVCGSGSGELLSLLAQAYCRHGDEILHSQHGFILYPILARTVGAIPVAVPTCGLRADVDGFLARVTERTKMIYLDNPNNPTGSYLSYSEVARLQAGLPSHVLLVLDAAYAEYVSVRDYQPGGELAKHSGNVVMVRTFSKIYALSGLRLGWAYGPSDIIEIVNRIRPPFNVSNLAQAAGVAALADAEFITLCRRHNELCRSATAERLHQLGLTTHPSVANFLLVSFAKGRGEVDAVERSALAYDFLKRHGIMVRKMEAYGLPWSLRVTIGRDHEMDGLVDGLAQFLDSAP